MRSVYRATTAAICAFLTGCAVAQSVSTNGTMLADDLTSSSRVVVDAFENSSNRVHELIETLSPNIVTNDGWFVIWKNLDAYESFFDNGIIQVTEGWDGTLEIRVKNDNAYLTVTNGAAWPNANVYAGEVVEEGSGEPFGYIAIERRNALGLARLTDITNTVTKAYVESLGIESGVSTNDVCNIVTNEVVKAIWNFSEGLSISNVVWTGLNPEDVTAGVVTFDVFGSFGDAHISSPSSFEPYFMATIGGQEFIFNIGGSAGRFPDEWGIMLAGGGDISYLGSEIESRNAIGLARLTDIAPTVSNTVTKAYVESLGIEAGISAETATNIAEAVGANLPYLSEDGGRVYGEVNIDSDLTSISVTADYLSVNIEAELEDTIVRGTLTLNGDDVATTNYANTAAANAVANADTTYRRFVSLTNINQSVQYVNITDATPSTLAISMPTDGATKDWMVYVVSVTNVTLLLPAATWWMADAAYTNDVPPATPTALWFSQVTDGVFLLGRQELTPVSIEGGN